MKTKEMTEVRAWIMFPELATKTCKYIPRNALFRHESIMLHGNGLKSPSAGIACHKPRSKGTTM